MKQTAEIKSAEIKWIVDEIMESIQWCNKHTNDLGMAARLLDIQLGVIQLMLAVADDNPPAETSAGNVSDYQELNSTG